MVDDEDGVLDSANGCASTMANVIVECFAKMVWTGDWCGVSVLFVHCCCFTSGLDRVSTNVADFDSVGNDLLHFVEDVGDVTKACAFL